MIRNKEIFRQWLLLLILLPCCMAAQRMHLQQEDYHKWHNLGVDAVSMDGTWAVYSLKYRNGQDTLTAYNMVDNKALHFPNGHTASISDNGRWLFCMVRDTLIMTNLHNLEKHSFPGVASYKCSGNKLFYTVPEAELAALYIFDTDRMASKKIDGVREFSLNSSAGLLAVVRKSERGSNSVEIIRLDKDLKPHGITEDLVSAFSTLTWNPKGNVLAFYGGVSQSGKNEDMSLYHCEIGKGGHTLLKMPASDIRQGTLSGTPILVSDDGNKIFFDLMIGKATPAGDPVLLKHDDLVLPPSAPSRIFWHVWEVKKKKVIALEDTTYPIALLTANQKYALLYDDQKYVPFHKHNGNYIDIYLKDLESGAIRLFLEKHRFEYRHVQLSPGGRYIAYFRQCQWWIYDISKAIHKQVEVPSGAPFFDTENDYPHEETYGVGGWIGDRGILLYDRYDIWLVDCNDGNMKKITPGRENDTQYRIYDDGIYPTFRPSFFGFTSKSFGTEAAISIIGINNKDFSYQLCSYTKNDGFKIVAWDRAKITSVVKTENGDAYFLESSFSLPPQLVKLSATGKVSVIAKSNRQQENYHWGKARLISFDACGKKDLKAALFYPADYDPGIRYPMVVNIYHDNAKELNQYVEPSLSMPAGFNVTNLTTNGFFVLMPDIHFILNEPGRSATESVLAACAKALAQASIDKGKIALMGHSFGGFETLYIISQTDFFATAIAGAAPTDLLGMYLDIDPYGKSNMERFNNGQFRNRNLFYDPKFSSESPLLNVKGINTPVLIYAGKEDHLVPAANSIKMHSALWQLGKESNLLLYPREGHLILEKKHQEDLYRKVLDWLNYKLKDKGAPLWLQ